MRGLDRVEPTSAPNRVCPVEKVEGSFYQVGWQYGQAARDEIRQALRRYADMAGTPQSKLLPELNANWDELSAKAETYFGRDGLEELRGMADGAGVPYSALLRHNLTVFPIRRQNALSMVESSGCVQLAGRASDGNFVCGGNLDVAFTRIVPDALRFSLVCRRVDNLIPSVSIVPTGLIGSRGGVNACGVAVTICDLLDEEFSSVPADGFRRGMLIQAILDRCANLDDVSRLIANSNLSGAKTLCVSDVRTGEIFHCENVGDKIVTKIGEPTVLQTNHSLLLKTPRANDAAVPEHSRVRFERLLELLNPTFASEFQRPSSEIFSVLRDAEDKSSEARAAESGRVAYRTMNMIQRRDNAYSWLFDAGKQTLEVCLTDSPYRVENETIRSDVFNVCELLPEFGDSSFRPTATSVSVPNVPKTKAAPNARPTETPNAATPSRSLLIASEKYDELFNNPPKPDPLDGKERVVGRYVDRLTRVVDLPKVEDASGQEATLILHYPSNRSAAKVRKRIAQLGGRAVSLSVYNAKGELENEDVLREKVRALLAKTPCRNVLLLSSFDSPKPFEYSKENWTTLSQAITGNMLFVLQEWYRWIQETGDAFENAQLLVATKMGGTLGLEGPIENPFDGAAIGFLHCLKCEVRLNLNKAFRAFLVDFPSNESPDVVADALLDELYSPAAEKEDVARLNGRRYAIRMIPDPAGYPETASIAATVPNGKVLASANVGERPVWLVTGGARGVTAELALALGKKYGAKLHLIGSSRLDGDPSWGDLDKDGLKNLRAQIVKEALARKEKPADAWAKTERKIAVYRNFKRFRDAGVEYEYHALDLCDYDATKALVERLLEQETTITGALFGAGFESSLMYNKKATASFRRTIDVKVGSVVAILEVLQKAPPKLLLGMGSIAGRLGSRGQVDYGLANTALGKVLTGFAEQFQDCRSVLFHWPAWDGVGMAVRPESKFVLQASGVKFMPIVEGVDAIFSKLDAEIVEREICVAEEACRQSYFNDILTTSEKPCDSFDEEARVETENARRNDKDENVEKSETKIVAPNEKTSTPVRGKVAVVGQNADSRALTRKIAALGADVSLVEPDEADWILIATPRDAANAKTNGFDRLGALDAIVRLVAKRRCDGGEFNVLVLGNATSQNAFGYDEAEAIRKELERDANVVVARFPNDEIPAELAAAIFDGSFEIAEKPNGGAKKTTPFGENFQRAENGTKRLELVADPTTDRFLLEHHLKGGAILPFAMSLELFCELATRGENADATTNRIEIKDVKTVNGMVFAEDKPYRLVCETVRSKDGSSESMRIVGDFYNAKGVLINRARPYVTASGARTLPNVPAETVQFPNLRYAFPDLNYVSCWMTEYPEKNKLRFYHGPAFQKLRGNTFLNENESVSEILIPRRDEIVESTKPEIGNKRSVTLDAIVLDASFWACGALNGFYRRNAIVVPHSLDLLQGRLGELAEGDACRVHVRRVGEESLAMGIRQIIFDFNVIDKNNRIVYTAKGFRMTELFAPSPY